MWRKNPKLFQDPQIDYPIYNLQLSFSDYILQSQQIIANTRQDLQLQPEAIIAANSPFELRPENGKPRFGVLLVHGLLDTPFIMQDIGRALQTQGALVRAILLPGHGTVPGALLNTRYTEWQQAMRYGIASLKNEVEKIILAGFSTGANLSLCSAVMDPAVAGIIMLAPAFKINSHFAFLANWHRAISWAWQRAHWFYIADEIDPVKYQSITFNAIYQVHRLGKIITKIPARQLAHCPIFLVSSYEDEIICSNASMRYFQQSLNPDSRALLYSTQLQTFNDPRIIVRKGAYPELNIASLSHISLPVASDNSHYGMKGDYPLASHPEKKVEFGAFDKADIKLNCLALRSGVTQIKQERLTYNPDFYFMQEQLQQFVLTCCEKENSIVV